jgi:hypothetical protein
MRRSAAFRMSAANRRPQLDADSQAGEKLFTSRASRRANGDRSLFWALLASGPITMRKVDWWRSLADKPSDQIIDLAG